MAWPHLTVRARTYSINNVFQVLNIFVKTSYAMATGLVRNFLKMYEASRSCMLISVFTFDKYLMFYPRHLMPIIEGEEITKSAFFNRNENK